MHASASQQLRMLIPSDHLQASGLPLGQRSLQLPSIPHCAFANDSNRVFLTSCSGACGHHEAPHAFTRAAHHLSGKGWHTSVCEAYR